MRHDWSNTRKLLVAGSIPDFEAFFKVHPLSDVLAIGYTWEWGQLQAAFYAVANTQKGLEEGMISANRYAEPKLLPEQAHETVRWEAGYFPFPAGFTGPNDELGAAWEAEADRLHDLTKKWVRLIPATKNSTQNTRTTLKLSSQNLSLCVAAL
jgi:hypothetical protein